jgi:uncharacterized protein (DUF983 family)
MARVPFQVGYRRALKLLCPNCGGDRLFSSFVRMNEKCSTCGLKYEREPGYFWGATYISYGWTAGTMTFAYLVLHIFLEYSNAYVLPPLLAYIVLFPIFFHRYARALWLAFDCFWDYTELENSRPHDDAEPASSPPDSPENPN